MGKTLRSSAVAGAADEGGTRLPVGHITERISLLEKRYSTVMVHQTYFKILDEWMQCMFGAELFPNPSDIENWEGDDPDEDMENPFYEVHMLHQRVNILEERLRSVGITIPSSKYQPRAYKTSTKQPPKKSYGSSPTPIRRRGSYPKPGNMKATPSKSMPPVLKPAGSTSTTPIKSKATEVVKDTKKAEDDKFAEGIEGEKKAVDEESKEALDDLDSKPPVLEEQTLENKDGDIEADLNESTISQEEPKTGPSSVGNPEDEEMEIDEDYYMEEEEEEDEFEQKPDLEDLDYEVARYTQSKIRAPKKKVSNNGGSSGSGEAGAPEDEPVITYTTRGRRHTLPRRYAEFTGHDNVASILKSQQRAAANQSVKAKKSLDKPKTPKPKAAPAPKFSSPKKADGTRPECVYKLIATVQAKEVDEAGDVVLWDPIPSAKVNQQQLISVIFRSNGMPTRLTRKLTTLVFEDKLLANTSPFGTKYYSERLPPEPLEAMVEFISNSGFDDNYTKKKIYMIIGQVCNEARAGRVRKIAPLDAPIVEVEVPAEEEPMPTTS